MRWSRNAGVERGHLRLKIHRTSYGVDDAAKIDKQTIAGSLEHTAVMGKDGRVGVFAPQRAQTRQNAVFVGAGQAAEADGIRGHYRRDLPVFGRTILIGSGA